MPEIFTETVDHNMVWFTWTTRVSGSPITMWEGARTTDEVLGQVADAVQVDAAFGFSDELGLTAGLLVLDGLRLSGQMLPAVTYARLLSEATRIVETMSMGVGLSADDAVVMQVAQTVSIGWVLADRIGVADTLAQMLVYAESVTEASRLQAAALHFLGADVLDTVGVTPQMFVIAQLPVDVTESSRVAATASPTLILRVTAQDTTQLDDLDVLQMLYDGDLRDVIQIEALQLNPAGTAITWCINTRQGFVSEYSNYAFNSFAQVGHSYFGATENGLYELSGDTDDGTSVIADIASGILQINGARFTGLKGVYIGMRGEGEFFLRLTSGDGQVYVYRLMARDMETTKVNIGKGFRHRYVSYELQSVGQDFELESIEFVPMRPQRRV